VPPIGLDQKSFVIYGTSLISSKNWSRFGSFAAGVGICYALSLTNKQTTPRLGLGLSQYFMGPRNHHCSIPQGGGFICSRGGSEDLRRCGPQYLEGLSRKELRKQKPKRPRCRLLAGRDVRLLEWKAVQRFAKITTGASRYVMIDGSIRTPNRPGHSYEKSCFCCGVPIKHNKKLRRRRLKDQSQSNSWRGADIRKTIPSSFEKKTSPQAPQTKQKTDSALEQENFTFDPGTFWAGLTSGRASRKQPQAKIKKKGKGQDPHNPHTKPPPTTRAKGTNEYLDRRGRAGTPRAGRRSVSKRPDGGKTKPASARRLHCSIYLAKPFFSDFRAGGGGGKTLVGRPCSSTVPNSQVALVEEAMRRSIISWKVSSGGRVFWWRRVFSYTRGAENFKTLIVISSSSNNPDDSISRCWRCDQHGPSYAGLFKNQY